MPTYVYRRHDGTEFEVRQPISDQPLAACPQTGQPVQRVLFAPAIKFTGAGFHDTDNPSRSRRHGAGRP